jgi:hypothetical protein
MTVVILWRADGRGPAGKGNDAIVKTIQRGSFRNVSIAFSRPRANGLSRRH